MKKISFIIAGAALLYSCDTKKATVQDNATISTAEAAMITDTAAVVTENSGENIPEATPANSVAVNPSAAPNTGNVSGKPALNPEHGQPFHRCDIQVGAPIDSAPQQAAAPQMAQPQMQSNNSSFNTNPIAAPASAPAVAPQALGPKPALNPAHGEPHHRCDLQVGAPLT